MGDVELKGLPPRIVNALRGEAIYLGKPLTLEFVREVAIDKYAQRRIPNIGKKFQIVIEQWLEEITMPCGKKQKGKGGGKRK